MNFCGQCGFLLPPGVAKCPHCGAVAQDNQAMGASHTNDETVLTRWDGRQQPTAPAHEKAAGAALDPFNNQSNYPDYSNPSYASDHSAATQDARTPFHGMNTPIPDAPV